MTFLGSPIMPDTVLDSPYLTLDEAAAFLRLAPRTLDNMRQRGTGPLYGKHGGRVRYHRDDLVAWADASRRRTTTEREPKGPPHACPAMEPTDPIQSNDCPRSAVGGPVDPDGG
jgi:Helix-turn-helix domain